MRIFYHNNNILFKIQQEIYLHVIFIPIKLQYLADFQLF
jgi:hypothetical protein